MDGMGFLELVRRRYSCRSYRPDPVPEEALARCVEALRLAPSACNRQPWRVVLATEPEVRRRLAEEALLPGIAMPWVVQAPVIAALSVRRDWLTHRVAPWFSGVRYDLLDPGIAGEHLVLAAAAEGLGSCWIGWIQPRAVRRILNLPGTFKPLALITLGYPAAEPETRSTRLPVEDICRRNRWE